MDKTYDPKIIEPKWRKTWEKLPQKTCSGASYCIMLPPPNVTGTLHMGHGFQQTLMDVLIRYHTMRGENTFWQGGTDHAGIATQMVVERELARQGKNRHDLGRETFIQEIWRWRDHSGNQIIEQMQRLGLTMDWEKCRFSMDAHLSYATREAFIRLYQEKLIYRGKRLVNWDPQLQTAISDLEVEQEEIQGHLWHIRYPLVNGSGEIIVATTRPETLLGDTAVAVHPEDERYHAFIGQHVKLPLTDRTIPIIADTYVDKTFGSGCVKITPAHDFNDYAVGLRHQLPMINIFTLDGHLNENTLAPYRGMERFAARKTIIAHLTEQNLLVKTEPHLHKIPKGDRSGTVIEPLLTDQWFVNMKPLAAAAIDKLRTQKPRFIPESWEKIYSQWLENIEDWCISRQLWWGHRIPVWYDEQGQHYAGHNEADVRERYSLPSTLTLTQESDVLDTWFTSSLWPFATLGWPNKTPDFETYFPTQVLVTGFDIIFFWVARMVMMSLKFTGKIPFNDVYITGLIRDSQGKKMSKSKGNVLDPIDLIDGIAPEKLIEKRTFGLMQPQMIEKIKKSTVQEFPNGIPSYGTDAVRFTFCMLATHGRDINFDQNRVEGYRNFCNKLWNATRFVLMNTEGVDIHAKDVKLSIVDQWIQSRLQATIDSTHQAFTQYRFDFIAQSLYEFTWNELCDWYLEFAKSNLNNPEKKLGTQITLLYVLDSVLHLLHPLMPFITEEISENIQKFLHEKEYSLLNTPYPVTEKSRISVEAEKKVDWLKRMIIAIRTLRSENNISPAQSITLLLRSGSEPDRENVEQFQGYIQNLTKITSIQWVTSTDNLDDTAVQVVDQLFLHIPLAGLIDKQSELTRLEKAIIKIQKDLEKSEKCLNNEDYLAKAPPAVVTKAKQDQEQLLLALKNLTEQQQKISRM